MKTFKRTLSLFLAVLMIFSCTAVAGAEETAETAETAISQLDEVEYSELKSAAANAEVTEEAKQTAALTDEDYLITKGTQIYNKKGDKVRLKGVNLGGWLVREDWLCPDHVPEKDENGDKLIYDGQYVYDTLQKRFGKYEAQTLLETYYDNWITEWDLDNIKSLGFNCVRVPFWYRNFYYDKEGDEKILDENGEWDFHYLDWVVEECSKRGLYVILDMHGAVGSQSDAPHSGIGFDGYKLYEDSERGEKYRERTIELWQAIATRFNGNPAVAMYDLLNEPLCDVADMTEIDRRKLNEWIYGLLYDAVREVDTEHLITMEAIWTALALPIASFKGWENVVYQVHFYQKSDFIFIFFCLFTRLYYSDVPLMMGEFYPHKLNDLISASWSSCFSTMNNLGIHWMLWTYKATGHGMWSSDWCLYGHKDGFWRADIANGSYDSIMEAWGERVQTESNFDNTGHYKNNVEKYL